MTDTKGLASIVNDACRSVVVIVINTALNVAHELIKFSLILFLVYYLGIWIFRFWDAVLDGSLTEMPSVFSHSQAQREIEATIAQLEKLEMQTDLKELESDFERFINAELRDSQLLPRSSQFEGNHSRSASISKPENDERSNNRAAETHEIESNIAVVSPVTSRTSQPDEKETCTNSSQEQLNAESQRMKAGTNTSIHSNVFDILPHSFEEALRLTKEMLAKEAEEIRLRLPPSFDEQIDHESFYRI